MTLTSNERPDPFTEVTGDADAARLLRTNLAAIAQEHDGTTMGHLVRDVLHGRRPLRDLEEDREFMQLTRAGVQQYEQHWASLSAEEKAQLSAEAEALLDGD